MTRYPSSLSGVYFNTDVTKSTGIALTNISALQGLTAVTIEAWISIQTLQSSVNGKIFSFFSGNTGFQLFYTGTSGVFGGQVGNGSTNVSPGFGGVNGATYPGGFHHVALVWDGSNAFVYVDGAHTSGLALTTGNTGNPAVTPYIGNQAASGRSFPGIISELHISNVARYTATFTPPTRPFTPDANTVGLYHLWDGKGTTANDSSASANNGTLSGSPLPIWSPGRFIGGGTSRSASSNRTQIQNFPASLSFTGSTVVTTSVTPSATAFGVMGWIKPGNPPTFDRIVECFTSNTGFRLYCNTSNKTFEWEIGKTGSSSNVGSSASASNNSLNSRWYHVAACYDTTSNALSLWVNGILIATNGLGGTYATATGQTLTFGAASSGLGNKLHGSLQNWSYTPSVLTTPQVLANMQQGIQPSGVLEVLPFTEGTGTTAYDTSGNANNGTITSGTYTSDVPSRARGLVGGNLVYNGGFEYAPPSGANVATTTTSKWLDGTATGSSTNSIFGWYLHSGAGSTSALFDSSQNHSGNYSLKVSTTATGSQARAATSAGLTFGGSNINPFPLIIAAGVSYTVTFWMKTTANSGAATTGAQILLISRSATGAGITTATSTGVTTTTGWTQYQLSTTPGAGSYYLDVDCRVTGNDGTATLIMDAWFDDIVLTPTVNTTRTLA